jgi:hypothetical protein
MRQRVLALVALFSLIALAGCGVADRAPQVPADLSPDGQALAAIGVDPANLQLTASTTSDGKHPKLKALRTKLRKNVLHGSTVVKTKSGTETIAVQRGSVTAVTSTSVTVKSSDGFSQTWTLGDKLTVVKNKAKAAPSDIKQGAAVGLAGTQTGNTTTARLIVLT